MDTTYSYIVLRASRGALKTVICVVVRSRDEDLPCHFFTSALQSALGCS